MQIPATLGGLAAGYVGWHQQILYATASAGGFAAYANSAAAAAAAAVCAVVLL